jgi:periplasmic iron binding protein
MNQGTVFSKWAMAGLCATVIAAPAAALEYPIGKPQVHEGMEVAAVYLQPIAMEPAGMMRDAKASDIHLEADIHATDKNGNGFADGTWIPYLDVKYELVKQGSTDVIKGPLMAMVANDGPHYGDNVKLAGPGRYKLKLTVAAPPGGPHAMFGRHVDKETGVGPWFAPFTLDYEFVFAGTGKKGGY